MFLKNTAYFYFILLIGVFVTACKKAPNYAKEPVIELAELKIVSDTIYPPDEAPLYIDSIYFIVHFQDGDGDIGNDQTENKDFIVNVYKKEAGIYTYMDMEDFDFGGNLPKFSDFVGPLDGTITQVTPLPYIEITNPFITFKKDDTLRFEIQLKDRANNYSNIITTPDYIVWKNFE